MSESPFHDHCISSFSSGLFFVGLFTKYTQYTTINIIIIVVVINIVTIDFNYLNNETATIQFITHTNITSLLLLLLLLLYLLLLLLLPKSVHICVVVSLLGDEDNGSDRECIEGEKFVGEGVGDCGHIGRDGE